MSTLRRRMEMSIIAMTLPALDLTKAICEVPYRFTVSDTQFELVQMFMQNGVDIYDSYVFDHPWRVATGVALVDPKFWDVWMKAVRTRPAHLEVLQ